MLSGIMQTPTPQTTILSLDSSPSPPSSSSSSSIASCLQALVRLHLGGLGQGHEEGDDKHVSFLHYCARVLSR